MGLQVLAHRETGAPRPETSRSSFDSGASFEQSSSYELASGRMLPDVCDEGGRGRAAQIGDGCAKFAAVGTVCVGGVNKTYSLVPTDMRESRWS